MRTSGSSERPSRQMILRRQAQGLEDGRHDVDRLDEALVDRAARQVGLGIGIDHDEGHAHRLLVEHLLFAQPMVAQEIAMVGGEDDQRVVEPAGALHVGEQAAQPVVDLVDQAHIGRPHRCRAPRGG